MIEFYVQANGDFHNSGSTNSPTPLYTSLNGNWNNSTLVFTPTDGSNPTTAGVAIGMYASVYLNAADAATGIGYISGVQNAPNGQISFGPTNLFAGATPTTGNGTVTLKVGGAQKIPTPGALPAPRSLGPLFYLTNVGSLVPSPFLEKIRVNCKNDAIYSVSGSTNQVTNAGHMVRYEPYTTTPGDHGKLIVEGPTTGTSFILWSPGNQVEAIDFEFRHNGATSNSVGLNALGAANAIFRRCVVHDVTGSGFQGGGAGSVFIDCEAYNCNQANNVGEGGFKSATGPVYFRRCIAHDNNNFGFWLIQSNLAEHCISDSNTGAGMEVNLGSIAFTFIYSCDFYNNGGDGIHGKNIGSGGSNLAIENCNFIKNGGYGINAYDTLSRAISGFTDNNGFGRGSMANALGDVHNMDHIDVNGGTGAGDVIYGAGLSPYANSPTGDFKIALAAAASSGYQFFYQTQPGYTGSIGMPVIGAVQLPGPPVGAPTAAETSGGFAT